MDFKNETIWAFFRIAVFITVFSDLADVDISNVVFGEIFPVMIGDKETPFGSMARPEACVIGDILPKRPRLNGTWRPWYTCAWRPDQ